MLTGFCVCVIQYGNFVYIIGIDYDLDTKIFKGATPFFVACQNGHLECGKELVKYKADYNGKRTSDGVTPLMMASFNEHESVVKWLLSLADIDVFYKNNNNWNAFYCAASTLNINIASTLYSYVMNECLYDNSHPQVVEFVNQPGINGCTPLMATFNDRTHKDPEKIVKFLVEKCKVRLDAKLNDGQTACDLAKQSGRHDLAEYLSQW